MVVQREKRTPTSGRPSCGVAVFVATTALLVLCRSVTAFVVDLSTSTRSRPYRIQVLAPCIFAETTFANQNQSDLSFYRYCYQRHHRRRHHHRHHQLCRCGLYYSSWQGLPKLSRLSFTVQWPFSASPRKLWKRVQRQISRRIPGFRKEKQQVKDKEDSTDEKSLRSERHVIDDEAEAASNNNNNNNALPKGPRWAIAAPHVDLSGTWKPIITPAFRQEYDRYLKNCGEGIWFRKTLLAAIGFGGTREEYQQLDQGRSLIITGITPVTQWKRTLVASGTTKSISHDGNKDDDYQPVYTSFCDPDGDTVQVEAWWEDQGTVHTSILRNKPRVLGGTFESKRYLDPNSNGHILICQSTFYPSETHGNYTAASSHKFRKDQVTWEFERLG